MGVLTPILFMAFAGTELGPVAKFSALPASDSLVIGYRSRGCFRRSEHVFRFDRDGRGYRIAAHENSEDNFKTLRFQEDKAIGTLALSTKDVQRLNNLLAFYRSPREGGCTTVDEIQIDQFRDGKRIASESFKDDSCDLNISASFAKEFNRPYVDALSLDRVLNRIKRPGSGTED